MPFVDREIEMSALEAAYKNPIASLLWSTVAVESERPLCSQSFAKANTHCTIWPLRKAYRQTVQLFVRWPQTFFKTNFCAAQQMLAGK